MSRGSCSVGAQRNSCEPQNCLAQHPDKNLSEQSKDTTVPTYRQLLLRYRDRATTFDHENLVSNKLVRVCRITITKLTFRALALSLSHHQRQNPTVCPIFDPIFTQRYFSQTPLKYLYVHMLNKQNNCFWVHNSSPFLQKCGQPYFMSARQEGFQLQTCRLAEVFQCVYVGEMPTQIYPGSLVHRPVDQHSPAE